MRKLNSGILLFFLLLLSIHCEAQPEPSSVTTAETRAETVVDIVELSDEDMAMLEELEQEGESLTEEERVTKEKLQRTFKATRGGTGV